MNCDEIFKKAYLQQLNIIKEDTDVEEGNELVEESDLNEECCGKEGCENCKPAEECGEINEDAEEAGEDLDNESEERPLQKVCFVTTDQALIDALNSGFEEAVFFVNAKDEESGEDKIVEVKFGKDSFGELEISAAEEDEIDEFEECKAPIEEDEEGGDEGGEEVAADEGGDESGEEPTEECNQLNECNKLLNELKEKRAASKYGPY
jgi:hypothetical protein